MAEIPKFSLYGQNDPEIEEAIQPGLDLRNWSDLETEEKENALQYITNLKWLHDNLDEVLQTISHLNHHYLRQCPGKNLHKIGARDDPRHGISNTTPRRKAAFADFQNIFLHEKSEAMVFRMLSRFAKCHIRDRYLEAAEKAEGAKAKKENIEKAFYQFDRLAICLNHVFDQFSVNVQVTRSGFVPQQDEKITEGIYKPTLKILADPKWKTVSEDLAQMFVDFDDQNYPEVITKAHRAVQRFLQILVGEEGKSGKGEMGRLFGKAKKEGIIPVDRFSEPIIDVFKGFFPSERANKSTAKPTLVDTTPSDALLVMNVVMVFLQHCLQMEK